MSSWTKVLKVVVAVAAGVAAGPLGAAIAGALTGVLSGVALSIVSGAIAGGIIGGVSAALTGGDWKKGLLYGAAGGAITGGMTDFANAGMSTGGISPEEAMTGNVLNKTATAPFVGPGDGISGGAGAGETVMNIPQPQTSVTPTMGAPTAAPGGATTAAAPPQVTKPGMLERITDFTKAHPWTQDVLKSGAEAVFEGIAAANTPTEGEQAMEVLAYKNQLMNQSLAGVNPAIGGNVAPSGYVNQSQLRRTNGQPVFNAGAGMLKFPGGG